MNLKSLSLTVTLTTSLFAMACGPATIDRRIGEDLQPQPNLEEKSTQPLNTTTAPAVRPSTPATADVVAPRTIPSTPTPAQTGFAPSVASAPSAPAIPPPLTRPVPSATTAISPSPVSSSTSTPSSSSFTSNSFTLSGQQNDSYATLSTREDGSIDVNITSLNNWNGAKSIISRGSNNYIWANTQNTDKNFFELVVDSSGQCVLYYQDQTTAQGDTYMGDCSL